MIHFLDLHAAYLELKEQIDSAVLRILDSGTYILGSEVEAFEAEWAAYCESTYAVGVGNGLDALVLSLRALDIGPGDEVIVPSHTYIATWLAVSTIGATPVPVEPDSKTYNIDPARITEAITPSTRAIIPVHLYGQPADLSPILAIAHQYNLAVVEDAAQAHGARFQGRRIGSHGDVVCWSFYPGKNLGAIGDGGAITTNRADLASKIRTLRNYGSSKKYVNTIQGVNSRLDPIQAAVLRTKLRHLDEWNCRRSALASCYNDRLNNSGLNLPFVGSGCEPVWHLFVVRTVKRYVVQEALRLAGISTLIHYPVACHQQQAYAQLAIPNSALPIASKMAAEVISLPISPHHSASEICQVADVLKTFLCHD